VFFTFFFPIMLVVIFGALVRTDPTGGGLFAEPPGYYAAGYVAVVVLFTPLSRVGSEVARTRDGRRFEKLATTPLSRTEWLVAHTAVNGLIIGLAAMSVLVLVVALTGASITPSPLLIPLVAVGVALFCGVGATLGALADSQDGAITASNAVGLPLLFLSETFVPLDLLPAWFQPVVDLSPLTYFSRGARAATYTRETGVALTNLGILAVLAVVAFAVGATLVPRTE